jgi:uncharacterized protein YjbI with pentapeptide repeats
MAEVSLGPNVNGRHQQFDTDACLEKLLGNKKHIELLKLGVREWNKSRPDSPDLTGADLRSLDLRGAALGRADLNDVQVLEASLRNANLGHANLVDAYMRRSDLGGAVRVPIQTIIQRGQREFAMFKDLFQAYSRVATPYEYDDVANLCASLLAKIQISKLRPMKLTSNCRLRV